MNVVGGEGVRVEGEAEQEGLERGGLAGWEVYN